MPHDQWRAGDDIDRIELHCSFAHDAAPSAMGTAWGGMGGSEHALECPEKGFLTGIHGVEGNPLWSASARVVRQLGFQCGYDD